MPETKEKRWHDEVWTERYGHVCPPRQGKIVPVQGLTGKDIYNPSLYEYGPTKILAFRAEKRDSNVLAPSTYHPSVQFARWHREGGWRVDPDIPPFDMLEDPFFLYIDENGMQRTIFGGVRVRNNHGAMIPQTELYKGDTLDTLERISFTVVHGMKDVRLLQLPDGRFLVCKRPRGDKYKRGRITLHIIQSLAQIVDIDGDLPVAAILDSCADALDWVGVNEARILKDSEGHAWIGLLGHVALADHQNVLHYAACTYKISLQDLLDNHLHKICPRIIATRECFEVGPMKAPQLGDVIFPGHLEHLKDYTYRLWAGLSDTRIGAIEIDDPFQLRSQTPTA